jgi:hypothetical protein
MERIFVLLLFVSVGALLTMILLPPMPRLSPYRFYPHRDWENEPIIGHPSPPPHRPIKSQQQ